NEKVETPHGKRVVLMPHPKEAYWIKKLGQRADGLGGIEGVPHDHAGVIIDDGVPAIRVRTGQWASVLLPY
ncbi:MAG: hypothetical protein R6X33_14500, partial [Candidatus Brocadiia bacterium]